MKAIMAISENGVIGNNGELPWHIQEDMDHFAKITKGYDFIMGRKTFESLPSKFFENHKGAHFFILTSNIDRVNTVVDTIGLSKFGTFLAIEPEYLDVFIEDSKDNDELMVIGGAEIYKLLLPHIDMFFVTELEKDVVGDTTFNMDLLYDNYFVREIKESFSYEELCSLRFWQFTKKDMPRVMEELPEGHISILGTGYDTLEFYKPSVSSCWPQPPNPWEVPSTQPYIWPPNMLPSLDKETVEDEETEDVVNNPKHYTKGGKQTLEMMEFYFGTRAVITFCTLNTFKYRERAPYKGTADQDYEKAIFYMNYADKLKAKLNTEEEVQPVLDKLFTDSYLDF